MPVEGCSTSEVASWRPNGRGHPVDCERDQQADLRWRAQVERICREAPRRLMDLSRHQYGLARQHLRLLPGEWPGRHRPVAWVLPAAVMAAMLCPPLLAYADSPIAGPEFHVNSYTTSVQGFASVAMDTDGDFVVAWESYQRDGDDYGVCAQRYNSDGSTGGTEFQVNTYTTDHQHNPSVAMDADGDFVVAWQSYGQDGEKWGVFARRYGLPYLSLGKEVDDDTPFSGQAINYTLVVTSSGIMTTTGAVISDTLPDGINFVGPVTVEPSGVGTPGTAPPTLVTDLTVAPGQRLTVTVPATVSTGLAEGTVLTNTAALTSAEISPPLTGVKSVTISLEEVYLPILLRSP